MSLNWKEIDLVLSELDLVGTRIERAIQPSFDSLALSLYGSGKAIELFFSIAQGACRIHSLHAAPPKPERPLRFQECLKSRLIGGRIEAVHQLGSERIVRFDIAASSNEGPVPHKVKVYKVIGDGAKKAPDRDSPVPGWSVSVNYRLYARLWSGAGNLILSDDDGIIVDVLARRPKRGEISGQPCRIEEELASEAPKKVFAIREFPRLEHLPDGGSFNERVEAHYSNRVGELSRDKLIAELRERSARRARALDARIAELEAKAAEFRDSERMRELGDILMANQGKALEGKYLACEDFYRGGEILIPVDPQLSLVENAQRLYERHRKARSGLAEVESEIANARASLARIEREEAELEALEDPFLIARALSKGGTTRPSQGESAKKRSYPGLSLERSGWTILIGRSAKENDDLLRHHINGSDLWVHARDWPGSYVFVKSRKGKSVPLEILLDAGMLAIYYSKGRSKGGGSLYYTFAKYLRRAKDGPRGTVLPNHEKNLVVQLDEARLRELRAAIGDEEA